MYSKIEARFWDDEKVLTLSPDARYLLIYLLTTKHRNVLGCYQLPKAYALEDTKLPEKRFSHAWRELFGSGIVIYEEDTRMILLKNFLRYNPIENPNQVKGALTKLEGLPRSDLFHTVYAHLEGLANEAGKPYLKPLLEALPKLFRKPFRNGCGNPSETLAETLPEPFRNGCGNPFETLSETLPKPLQQPVNSKQYTVSSNSKQEEDIPPLPPIGGAAGPEPDGTGNAEPDFLEDAAPKPRRRKPSTLTKTQETRFNAFWAVYPRKVSIGDAEKAWAKIEPDEELAERIINAVETAKAFDSRFREIRYTPHPATWLNGREWENQYSGPEDVAPQARPRAGGKPNTLEVLGKMLDEEGGDDW